MRRFPLVILIPLATLCSCESEIVPVASFQVLDARSNTPILTHETLTVTNTSQNGVKFNWDFGNGTTSTEREPTFSYATSGTYPVKLIVESKDGLKRTEVKEITVLDRVLKQLTVESLSLRDSEISELDGQAVDLFLTIKQYRNTDGTFTDKTVYQSEVVTISSAELPYTIQVLNKVIIDPSLLNSDCLSFNLHVNHGGSTYTIGSNLYSGSSFGQWTVPGRPLSFATSSVGGSFLLECEYE